MGIKKRENVEGKRKEGRTSGVMESWKQLKLQKGTTAGRQSKKRPSISLETSTARQQEIAQTPKTALCLFLHANVLQRAANVDCF